MDDNKPYQPYEGGGGVSEEEKISQEEAGQTATEQGNDGNDGE